MRIIVIADGDPREFSTNSGVARGVLRALQADDRVSTAIPVDGSIPRALRLPLAALTIRPGRSWWWANFNLGLLNILVRAAVRAVRLRPMSRDLTLLVRNIHLPMTTPYAVFVDTTTSIANRNWASWRTTPLLRLIRHRIERVSFHRATFVFTAGAQTAAEVIEVYGVPAERVAAVGGGVNFDPLPAPARIHRQMPSSSTILFVGKDFKRKGGDLLVEAFAIVRERHPEARLVFAGPDPAEVPQAPGIVALGHVSDRDAVAAVFDDARVFCLPSRHEPYGLALQEAMAFGLPCVATRVGAIPTIVRDGETGIVVEPDSAIALAEALDRVLADDVLAIELGRNGRAAVESNFTWEAVVDRMLTTMQNADRT